MKSRESHGSPVNMSRRARKKFGAAPAKYHGSAPNPRANQMALALPHGKCYFISMHKSGCSTLGICATIVWVAQFLACLPGFCSWEHLSVGSLLPMLMATISALGLGIVIGGYLLLKKSHTDSSRRNLVYSLAGLSLLWVCYCWADARPTKNFERRVTHPIPNGITDLKVKGFSTFGAQWSFEFQADADAIAAIVKGRKLELDSSNSVLENLRQKREPLTPDCVKDPNTDAQISYYEAKIPESDEHRGRTFWLAYHAARKRAWFLYYAPM